MFELDHALAGTRYLAAHVRTFKVGGLRFLRVGRVQLSFCVCRPK